MVMPSNRNNRMFPSLLTTTTTVCLGALLFTSGIQPLTPLPTNHHQQLHHPHHHHLQQQHHHRMKRLVGGQSAAIESAPFAVQLVLKGQSFCTGSLIDYDKVLTAGHCVLEGVDFIVYGTARKYTTYDDDQVVSSSSGGRSPPSRRSYQFKKANVSRVIVHPQYRGGVSPADIAILQLASPVDDHTARPIALETEGGHCNMAAVVYGFGQSAYTYSPSLQAMSTRLINSCRTRSVNANFLMTQTRGRTVCNVSWGLFVCFVILCNSTHSRIGRFRWRPGGGRQADRHCFWHVSRGLPPR